jgi:NADPH:quinone reductase-like Zn-dependent oxidoreductase
MKAVVRGANGSPEVVDVDVPVPNEREVLIRVRAASVNDFDFFIMRPPLPIRIVGSIARTIAGAPPRPRIPGCDVAGTVESVGPGVQKFRPGDPVFGDLSGGARGFGGFGGFAEYVCAAEDALLAKPPHLTFEQAAALPQAGALAMQGLLARGPLQPGWKILINGAGGGVGTIGVQVAKLHGAFVTGVDRASKLEMMRSIGFDHVIDFEREDFTRSGKTYDLIVDTKTNRSAVAYLRALAPGGVYATVGGQNGRLVSLLLVGLCLRPVLKKKLVLIGLSPNRHLAYLAERAEAGQLVPVIDGSYTLRAAPDAMRYFMSGQHKGKVILTV